MAYEPTVWNCDDEISAEKLNKLEEGVAQIMSDYVPTQWVCDDVITAEKLNKLEQAVAEASEGGSCELTSAQVTVKHSGDLMLDAYFPSAIVIERNNIGQQLLAPSEMGDKVYSIVLYKGKYVLDLQPSVQTNPITNISGAITADTEEDIYIITGDCAITMNGQLAE